MSFSLLFFFDLFCFFFAEEEGRSEDLVLTEMHPLDDVTTIIEHAANILRIDGAGEVRVAMSPNAQVLLCNCVRWGYVSRKIGKKLVQSRLSGSNFLGQQILKESFSNKRRQVSAEKQINVKTCRSTRFDVDLLPVSRDTGRNHTCLFKNKIKEHS
jgi:hypothetical protein